jgi:TRAP-type uncharacterized transport system substrate-binding protein
MSIFERVLPARSSRRRVWWLGGILLFALVLLLSIRWFGPGPPKKIVLACGARGSVYGALGEEYKRDLEAQGMEVELLHDTRGSVDNLRSLIEGKAQLALVQGGIYSLEQDPRRVVRGLAVVDVEPVWVFYRDGLAPAPGQGQDRESLRLSDLPRVGGMARKTFKVAVGPVGSGTAALSEKLLEAHGITSETVDVVYPNTLKEAGRKLQKEQVDIGFFVTAPENQTVKTLLEDPRLRLMHFRRRTAYSRHFPYLTQVTLAEGVIKLQANIPSEDVELLAPPTLLVCRDDLHPRAIEQVLGVARKIHDRPSKLSPQRQFPNLEGLDQEMPVHPSARRYMESGESWLAQLMPYWMLRHTWQMQILLLPLITLLLPYFRIFPWIYSFRINRLLRQHYKVLREMEEEIEQTNDPQVLREGLKALDRLRREMEGVSRRVPFHLQREVYHWRLHVIMVRNEVLARLRAILRGQDPSAASFIERSIHAPGLDEPGNVRSPATEANLPRADGWLP